MPISRLCGALAAVALLATACGSRAPTGVPSEAPRSVSPSPTVSGTPSQPAAALPTCRLPITWRVYDSAARQWSPASAGFMSLPAGTIEEDAQGTEVARRQEGAFYDLALGRWVPATRNLVSPDGSQYLRVIEADAYVSSVHIVDAVSGAERVLVDGPWVPLDFAADGVYLARAVRFESGYAGVGIHPAGVYFVPLSGGTPTRLSDLDAIYFNLGAGAGWALAPNQEPRMPNRLLRFDLRGGVEDWLAVDTSISALFLDRDGYPLVVTRSSGGLQVASVQRKGAARQLFSSPDTNPMPEPPFAVNALGTWVTTRTTSEPFSSAPWLIDAAGTVHALPAVTPRNVEVAGGCL